MIKDSDRADGSILTYSSDICRVIIIKIRKRGKKEKKKL